MHIIVAGDMNVELRHVLEGWQGLSTLFDEVAQDQARYLSPYLPRGDAAIDWAMGFASGRAALIRPAFAQTARLSTQMSALKQMLKSAGNAARALLGRDDLSNERREELEFIVRLGASDSDAKVFIAHNSSDHAHAVFEIIA